ASERNAAGLQQGSEADDQVRVAVGEKGPGDDEAERGEACQAQRQPGDSRRAMIVHRVILLGARRRPSPMAPEEAPSSAGDRLPERSGRDRPARGPDHAIPSGHADRADTLVVHGDRDPEVFEAELAPPVHMSVTWSARDADEFAGLATGVRPQRFYTRYGNPTHERVARLIARLEGGENAL